MSLDPLLVAETRARFQRAAEDLRAADFDFRAMPPLLADVVFHCQQAAEKAMKGFLTWHNRPFRRTHSLEEVGAECLTIAPSLQSLVDRSAQLSDYAWRYRYPGSPVGPPLAEAQEAFGIAGDVYDGILARLPTEVRP